MTALCVPIVSAQAAYGATWPAEPTEWKKRAFADLLAEGHYPLNLISIGDMEYERIAAKSCSVKGVNIQHAKTIKFIEMPTMEQLEAQLAALADYLSDICEFGYSADWNTVVEKACPSRCTLLAPGQSPQWTAHLQLLVKSSPLSSTPA